MDSDLWFDNHWFIDSTPVPCGMTCGEMSDPPFTYSGKPSRPKKMHHRKRFTRTGCIRGERFLYGGVEITLKFREADVCTPRSATSCRPQDARSHLMGT